MLHPAGRLAACPGRRHAGRPAPVAAGPRRAPARRPDRAGHPGRHPRLGAPGVRRPRHGRPARRSRRSSSRTRTPRRSPLGGGRAGCSGRTCLLRVLDEALAALRARALRGTRSTRTCPAPSGPGSRSSRPSATSSPASPAASAGPRRGSAASSALPALLAGVDPDERRVLETLAAGPPVGRSRGGADPASPVSRLLARGLLVRVDAETVELPRQVGLALRGDRPLGALALDPPDLATVDRGVGTVDGTAAGAALRALRQVEQLVAFWATTPAAGAAFGRPRCAGAAAGGSRGRRRRDHGRAARRDRGGGGPGRGERRRRARVGADDHGRRLGGRGPGAEVGRAGPRLARPAARAGARRHPGRRRAADRRAVRRPAPPDGPPRPPPGARRRSPSCRRERPWATSDALAGLLAWRAPRRGGRLRDEVVRLDAWPRRRCWASSRSTRSRRPGGRCSTEPGARRRRAARRAARARSTTSCCRPTSRPSRPARSSPSWSASWTSWARSSRRAGRPSTGSPRRRCAVRWTPGAPLRSCTSCSRRARRRRCPQGLTYLVDDVARRHGRLRGGAAASFLRSDDEVLIAEVLASPAAGSLELRRIAPTVAVSPLPLAELMDGLRGAGFTPAAEDEGGAVLDLTDRGRRISPRRRSGPSRAVGTGSRAAARPRVADARRRRAGRPAPQRMHRAASRGRGRRHRRDPPRGRARAAQRVDRLRRRPRGRGRAGAGADERRRRGRRGPRQRGRRPAPRPAAPDHLDRAGGRLEAADRRRAAGPSRQRAPAPTRLRRPSGAASRARPARSGSASPTRGRGRRS